MADTRVQLLAENWIRNTWLPEQYQQSFSPQRLTLTAGGHFVFDAVSTDGTIVVNISTSSAKTAGGRRGAGKLHKLRADMLFLLMANTQQRLIVLTEADMFELCQNEKKNGRVPREVEFLHAEIPGELAKFLREARERASYEVTPQKGNSTSA
jgi:hypothetical protein